MSYPRIATFKTAKDFRHHLQQQNIALPFDDALSTGDDALWAQPLQVKGKTIGNRFAILPMEGWDGTTDGHPSELTIRRWQRFGLSGAKLIWGGEAVAVRHDGRANPNQLVANQDTLAGLAHLRETLVKEHEARFGHSDDLLIGLQLTHSGRFSRPHNKQLEPHILYRHPWLDRKFNLPAAQPVLSDDDIARLIEDFGRAAQLAQRAGFAFVDIKHCHGYLGHEFLSAVDRDGRYGGCFENRTRFLRETVAAVRASAPQLDIGVRLSAFDWMPFKAGAQHIGEPEPLKTSEATSRTSEVWSNVYPYAFGGDGTGTGIDLSEPLAFLDVLTALDIQLVCITAGSPYYNPHIQRPTLFPPSDGYQPPRRPSRGRRATNCRRRAAQASTSTLAVGRHRLFIFARVVAQCRAARVTRGHDRCGWHWAHGAYLSRHHRGRVGGQTVAAQASLPHVQRLHDRAAQRSCVGLLSIR
jgi:2,4-dienoyl-CoA reductase-like NADH-dependent reductase (Old Yellow Enzyme family)